MKTIELFSGTKSFSKVMKKHGHSTLTFDNNIILNPDIFGDILKERNDIAKGDDILWASPPCTAFSVASIGSHWKGGVGAYIPKTNKALLAIKLVEKTILIIEKSKPKFWFIENPRGMLRKMPFMEKFLERNGGIRHTVTYCQYGDTRMKPTDIWTNCKNWKPKPMCKRGSPCHEAAPRGSKTGTQGIKGAKDRGRIPSKLFIEILKYIHD